MLECNFGLLLADLLLNTEELIKVMEAENWHFLLRSHSIDDIYDSKDAAHLKKLVEHPQIHEFSSRIMADELEVAVAIDLIITDYSGIYLDFLLVDVPVLFIPYDIEKYKIRRGLLFDYELFTPGPKPVTQIDFISEANMKLPFLL